MASATTVTTGTTGSTGLAQRRTLTIHLPAEPERLREARAFARGCLAGVLEEPEATELLHAFGEACTNAVQHGSPRGKINLVRIAFSADDWHVEFVVEDEGPGFDVGAVPEPDVTTGQEHGYGCFFMRQVAGARWERLATGMRVSLSKRYDTHATAVPEPPGSRPHQPPPPCGDADRFDPHHGAGARQGAGALP